MSDVKWVRPSGSTIVTADTKEMSAYAKKAGWKRPGEAPKAKKKPAKQPEPDLDTDVI